MTVRSVAACLVLAAATVTACTSAVPGHGSDHHRHRHRSASPSHSPVGPPTHTDSTTASSPTTDASTTSDAPIPAAGETAQQALARMTLRERIGQLLMVDCPSTEVAPATVTAIRTYHVGSVILDGTTHQGVAATAAVTRQLRHLAPRHVKLFIATDQEGGLVQRLQGPGFSTMPSAVEQGQWTPQHLQHAATRWGQQLRAAGVNVNLAPVLDTVPAGFGSNPPIGDLDREYGHRPVRVRVHGLAFAAGMRAAGVDATGKHFPGLGRVHGNTDTTSGVTDKITTRHDAYLRPFAAAAQAHIAFLMVSTAIYARIDPGVPAAFSRTIVTGILRGDLGYRGVIISDDLGAAAQVRNVPVGRRAVRFIRAGGDVVITVEAAQTRAMTHALLVRARHIPTFAQRVDEAALTVLRAKRAAGLLR